MSFQDLELGRAFTGLPHMEQSPSRALVVKGVFKIKTAVDDYERLVYRIGTQKDTADLRHKLHKTRSLIRQLVKDTSADLHRVRETNEFAEVDATKKIADAKLTKDYESVLKFFEKAQLLAAEKEKAFAPPIVNSTYPSSSAVSELEISSSNPKQAAQLRESERNVVQMETEITLNEAMIEEREQGIQEIHKQIGEVNEIFRDLALLVSEQGAFIGDISSNVNGSAATTLQATSQLAKASDTQRSASSMNCLMVVILGIIMLILVFVLLA